MWVRVGLGWGWVGWGRVSVWWSGSNFDMVVEVVFRNMDWGQVSGRGSRLGFEVGVEVEDRSGYPGRVLGWRSRSVLGFSWGRVLGFPKPDLTLTPSLILKLKPDPSPKT
ncbi:hypothetical protein TIFTF001_017232 [Ficus carica]|uniref:Uncharacterized protein n=1 Tax=Ficus carica TaxID=3494 RepID=A0AA88A1S8_FICCA|nr:hypothetical protein TIFTF001_017232 [Ficus carica]